MKYVIRCPIAVDEWCNPIFGYAKRLEPHGKTSDVYAEKLEDALRFNTYQEAKVAGEKILPGSFSPAFNIFQIYEE